jgi:Icc-related predicted phosphoesterase
MKILILSDLHLEFASLTPPASKVDVVILAGDIWKKDQGIYWARETWPEIPIIYVAGNHEFYRTERNACLSAVRSSAHEANVHFLENDEIVIEGVRFLGCSLWTDFELFIKTHSKEAAIERCIQCLADFRWIVEGAEPFSPDDAMRLFHESAAWLTRKLMNEPFDGKTVVITHHLPSMRSVAPQYANDLSSAGFASNLDALFGYSELWIHGHTHTSFDYIAKGTRVICNPRGYILRGKAENPTFNPELVIKV